jgi:hypothetical protein
MWSAPEMQIFRMLRNTFEETRTMAGERGAIQISSVYSSSIPRCDVVIRFWWVVIQWCSVEGVAEWDWRMNPARPREPWKAYSENSRMIDVDEERKTHFGDPISPPW